jgi:hypothetical protein
MHWCNHWIEIQIVSFILILWVYQTWNGRIFSVIERIQFPTFALMLLTIKKIMDLGAHKLCISLKWCLVHSSFQVQIWIKIRANHFKLTQCKWYLTLPWNLSKTQLPKVASWTLAQTWINRHYMISWRTFIMTMLLMSTKSSKRTKSIINLVHIKEALKPTHVAVLKN